MASEDVEPTKATLEDMLAGLGMLEAILDKDRDTNLEIFMQNYSLEERYSMLLQFCVGWVVSESHTHEEPIIEYLAQLRARLINGNFSFN